MDEFALVFNSLFMSSIMEKDIHIRWVWMGFVVDRDKNGEVYGTDRALAGRWGVSMPQFADALHVLSGPDSDSTSDKDEGRRIRKIGNNRWLVVNHEEYRSSEQYARQKEQGKLRQQAKRDKDRNASSRSVTIPSVSVSCDGDGDGMKKGESEGGTKQQSKSDKKTLERFEIFWERFSHKHGRKQALKAWKTLKVEDQQKAVEVAPQVGPWCLATDTSRKMGQGWLNDRRWEDDYTIPQKKRFDGRWGRDDSEPSKLDF